jgi:hypothetical protein
MDIKDKNYGVIYKLLENNTYQLIFNISYIDSLKFNFSDKRNKKISKLFYKFSLNDEYRSEKFYDELKEFVDKSLIEIAKLGNLEEISIINIYPNTDVFIEALHYCNNLKKLDIEQILKFGDDNFIYHRFSDEILEKVLNLPKIEELWLSKTFLNSFPENKNINNTLKTLFIHDIFSDIQIVPKSIKIVENICTYKSLETLYLYNDDLIKSDLLYIIYDKLPNLKKIITTLKHEDLEILKILEKFKEKGVIIDIVVN